MQDKMKKLLEQIGMKNDYLENANIDKIVVYDKTNLWEFIINNDKVLPVYIYNELNNKIKSTFSKINDISIIIKTSDDELDYLDDYFDKLIYNLADNSVKYKTFVGRKLKIENNKFIFDVYNKAEYSYMIEKIEYLNKMLNRYGFKNSIDIYLREDKEQDILNDIEKDKIVSMPKITTIKEVSNEIKSEEKRYFRPKRDTTVTPIKDIFFETDNITIEGLVFGIDMFEAKSGYKIITLKVTDNTDSIYVKMFTKDTEEYVRIKDLLKQGSWYNFYGRVQMDKYANELTFTTRYKDVEKIEAPPVEKI